MKTYFRLLSFVRPIGKYAFPYGVFSILSVVFNTLNLALLIPLLDVLFIESAKKIIIPPQPHFEPSFKYPLNLFYYYFARFETDHGRLGALEFVCAVILISVFISNVFRYLSQRIMEDLRVISLMSLRQTVFNNVMDLHLSYFSNERKGNILSKIASDVQVVQFSITNTLQVVFKDPLQLLAYLAALFSISARLTLLSLLVVPVSGLIIASISKRLRQQAVSAQSSYGRLISILEEALSGIKIIMAFNAGAFVKEKFAAENSNFARITRSMSRRQQLASPISEFLGVATVIGIVLYGGSLIIGGQTSMSASAFIAYIAIYSQVINPVKSISNSFSNIHQGLAAGDRVLELIDKKPEIQNRPGARKIAAFYDKIEFRDVCFAYGSENVLQDISFTIEKGESVALIGPSGGGKSTVSDLLPRFYDISSGSILIDGIDIRDIDIESLRALMGIVNQESILFNDSITENIRFGRSGVSEAEIDEAAQIANAKAFILNSESGFETNIGDRGVKLSGGQKQRLSIARAILINPPILILDEATSALDTESEKLVQDALNKLMKTRTSLVIAHRLSTIQNSDKILVLEKGRIVQSGSHQSLMAIDGLYRKLINMQSLLEV